MLYAFGVTFAIVAGILAPFILSVGAAILLEVIEYFQYKKWKG